MAILWKTPITNRTASDVAEALRLASLEWADMTTAEQTSWKKGLKGCLNSADLIRIENNIHLLSDVLELDLTTYESSIPVIPTVAYWTNLLSNVAKIRSSYAIYDTTPKTPTFPINTYGQINNIEQILLDVYTIISNNFYYESVDEFYCGEEVGLLL